MFDQCFRGRALRAAFLALTALAWPQAADAQVSFMEGDAAVGFTPGAGAPRFAAPPPARRYGLEPAGGLYRPYIAPTPGGRIPMTIDSTVNRAAFPAAPSLASPPSAYAFGGGERLPDRAMVNRPVFFTSGRIQPQQYAPTAHVNRLGRMGPAAGQPAPAAAPVPRPATPGRLVLDDAAPCPVTAPPGRSRLETGDACPSGPRIGVVSPAVTPQIVATAPRGPLRSVGPGDTVAGEAFAPPPSMRPPQARIPTPADGVSRFEGADFAVPTRTPDPALRDLQRAAPPPAATAPMILSAATVGATAEPEPAPAPRRAAPRPTPPPAAVAPAPRQAAPRPAPQPAPEPAPRPAPQAAPRPAAPAPAPVTPPPASVAAATPAPAAPEPAPAPQAEPAPVTAPEIAETPTPPAPDETPQSRIALPEPETAVDAAAESVEAVTAEAVTEVEQAADATATAIAETASEAATQVAAAVETVETEAEVVTGLQARLLFAEGAETPPAAAAAQIDRVAGAVGSSGPALTVFGFAGGDDDRAARELALSRAINVRNMLRERGLDFTRMNVKIQTPEIADGPADRVDIIVDE